MKLAMIIICVLVAVLIGIVIYLKSRNKEEHTLETADVLVETAGAFELGETATSNELVIEMEMLPADVIKDKNSLVEIKDSKVLAHINNLVPELGQIGNAVNNAAQVVQTGGETLYRAIIPAGAQLCNSTQMEGALRGMYHGTDGIKGHANLVAVKTQEGAAIAANTAAAAMGVASMIVGQYYMAQISSELRTITYGISKIQDFQDSEYRSRVFSLVQHIKKLAAFNNEIIENDELRLSKITQLDRLEEECTQLLGQANLMLASFAQKNGLSYSEYEEMLIDANNWFMYQKTLLDVMYRIAELKYAIHLGTISRAQCESLLPTYTKQVSDTQMRLTSWHQSSVERLGIQMDEIRRKRSGFDGVVHFIPGIIKNDFKYRAIEEDTARMIETQALGHKNRRMDTSELYRADVQLIAKDGKIYYLPESRAAE